MYVVQEKIEYLKKPKGEGSQVKASRVSSQII